MHNEIPLLNVDLHVSPDFSGRILLYVENGLVKADMPLHPGEIVGTQSLFEQILERAGYCVALHLKD